MSETETLCALCGEPAKGYAWNAANQRVCHTSDPATDCYSKARARRSRTYAAQPE